LSDEVVERIAAGASLLGLSADEGGMGDEQALRALLLLIRTGRRINEVLMLDFDPLETLQAPLGDAATGFVARVRYQQTKVYTANPSILADAEVVALVKAQQAWCSDSLRSVGNSQPTPKYLFVKTRVNRLGLHPDAATTLRSPGDAGRPRCPASSTWARWRRGSRWPAVIERAPVDEPCGIAPPTIDPGRENYDPRIVPAARAALTHRRDGAVTAVHQGCGEGGYYDPLGS